MNEKKSDVVRFPARANNVEDVIEQSLKRGYQSSLNEEVPKHLVQMLERLRDERKQGRS